MNKKRQFSKEYLKWRMKNKLNNIYPEIVPTNQMANNVNEAVKNIISDILLSTFPQHHIAMDTE